MKARLLLEDGSEFEGQSFGAEKNTAGEVVFTTGMVGYPESITDASYDGQILIFTYPIMGSYGIPNKALWESKRIQPKAIIVSDYIDTPSHFSSEQTLGSWLQQNGIVGIEIKDTRALAIKLREKGTMLGKIVFDNDHLDYYDPNTVNIVADVSTQKVLKEGKGEKNIILIDCGAKHNIARCLVKRNVQVTTIPWSFDPFDSPEIPNIDGLLISNGPGDPKMADKTIQIITKALTKDIPILGICLGHQLLALAAGGDTEKLKFGHRSQNQPCIMADLPSLAGEAGPKRCYITTQNHGFTVSKIPNGFEAWFTNANDGSNEGIKHKTKPIMSVQFHPEARPGPTDTEWIFDYFLEQVRK